METTIVGFKTETIISKWRRNKGYSTLHFRTDFTFKKAHVSSRNWWKRTCWHRFRLQKKKTKRTRQASYHLIRINTDKIDSNDYEECLHCWIN